jgi:hypothetical protein
VADPIPAVGVAQVGAGHLLQEKATCAVVVGVQPQRCRLLFGLFEIVLEHGCNRFALKRHQTLVWRGGFVRLERHDQMTVSDQPRNRRLPEIGGRAGHAANTQLLVAIDHQCAHRASSAYLHGQSRRLLQLAGDHQGHCADFAEQSGRGMAITTPAQHVLPAASRSAPARRGCPVPRT